MIYDLGTMNLRDLAEHLGAIDTRTARTVANDAGIRMAQVRTGAPAYIEWLEVFRKLHGIEPAQHADILAELKADLVPLRRLAEHLGTTPDALKKREQRGRITLPLSIKVGKLRLWRPRDLRLWQLGQEVPSYAKPTPSVPVSTATPTPASRGSRAAGVLGFGAARTAPGAQITDKTGTIRTAPT